MALPARLVFTTGPFIGTWRRYAAPSPSSRIGAVVGTCRRCHARTWDARAGGWYYAHGHAGQLRRQLCPVCVAVLWAEVYADGP